MSSRGDGVDPVQVASRHPSPVPARTYPLELEAQQQELAVDPLMARFRASRRRLSADPYRPVYHFTSPESLLNDPNGLCFWRGRWHLFYQAYPPDEFPDPADVYERRQHWGHAVSDDLVHWTDLPYAIHPGIDRMCFSGSTVVEDDRVIAFYQGIGAGTMVAVASDPLLLNWTKTAESPVITAQQPADPCIWKEGDRYFALLGGEVPYSTAEPEASAPDEQGVRTAEAESSRPRHFWPSARLWTSTDLASWTYEGEFLVRSPLTGPHDGVACPNFVPIGDRHILLFFSHTNGGEYLLGHYDRGHGSFTPYDGGRFNQGPVAPGGVHAPSAAADGAGGVVNILNINEGRASTEWDHVMSLAQRLSLGADRLLRIEPVPAVSSLRRAHGHVSETVLPANEELVLPGITGSVMELDVEIDPLLARWVRLDFLRSQGGEERTSITFFNYDRVLNHWYHTKGVLCLDGSNSSLAPDVWVRPPERVDLERGAETLRLRVFLDRSVVEVFANERRYLAMRVYPSRDDSLGVSLTAHGQDALLKRLDAWQMASILP